MINQEKIKQIKLILTGLAEYYGVNLSVQQLNMYSEDLYDLDLNDILKAVKIIRTSSEFFPKPSTIIQSVKGKSIDNAIDVSNLIVLAMSKYGWTNPDKAKIFMGELAWEVVEREGGWQRVCETSSDDQLPILKAQWRELARVLLNKNSLGKLNERPSLNNKEPNKLLEINK